MTNDLFPDHITLCVNLDGKPCMGGLGPEGGELQYCSTSHGLGHAPPDRDIPRRANHGKFMGHGMNHGINHGPDMVAVIRHPRTLDNSGVMLSTAHGAVAPGRYGLYFLLHSSSAFWVVLRDILYLSQTSVLSSGIRVRRNLGLAYAR